MSFFNALFGAAASYPEITVAQLDGLRPGTRLIDVREPDEFTGNLGHLDGAESVPLATLQSAAKNWDKDAAYLMICRSGNRSGQACNLMLQMGFKDVTNLRGGMMSVAAQR